MYTSTEHCANTPVISQNMTYSCDWHVLQSDIRTINLSRAHNALRVKPTVRTMPSRILQALQSRRHFKTLSWCALYAQSLCIRTRKEENRPSRILLVHPKQSKCQMIETEQNTNPNSSRNSKPFLAKFRRRDQHFIARW